MRGMYRAPDETPRCACCRSPELTDVTRFDPTEGSSNVWFAKKDPTPGWFVSDRESFALTRARVCLSCGHVMWSLAQRELERLRDHLPQLAALPES